MDTQIMTMEALQSNFDVKIEALNSKKQAVLQTWIADKNDANMSKALTEIDAEKRKLTIDFDKEKIELAKQIKLNERKAPFNDFLTSIGFDLSKASDEQKQLADKLYNVLLNGITVKSELHLKSNVTGDKLENSRKKISSNPDTAEYKIAELLRQQIYTIADIEAMGFEFHTIRTTAWKLEFVVRNNMYVPKEN